eukprot:1155346-Pelagomonas_calceolata.AAC.2
MKAKAGLIFHTTLPATERKHCAGGINFPIPWQNKNEKDAAGAQQCRGDGKSLHVCKSHAAYPHKMHVQQIILEPQAYTNHCRNALIHTRRSSLSSVHPVRCAAPPAPVLPPLLTSGASALGIQCPVC